MKATRQPGRFWKLLRIYFRRFRICLWLVVLTLLAALFYVNQIGLPDFVKKPLLEKLRERGVDLQFARLRLRFPHGLVADEVFFGQSGNNSGPTFALKQIQVRLDYAALAKRQIQINSLLLRQGRLVWPVMESNRPPRELTVENIETELLLLPGDLWQLNQFKAQFAGANISLAGTVTNASRIRDWKIFQGRPAGVTLPGEAIQTKLRQLADALEQIHFPSAPELKLEIYGDALALPGFGGRAMLRASGAETPWGSFEQVDFSARVHPPENSVASHCEIFLRAASARTPWATAEKLDLTLHVLSEAATNFDADLSLTAGRVGTEWGRGTAARFTAQWRNSATNAIPLSGRGQLQLDEAETPWGSGRGLHLSATLATPTNADAISNANLGWWKLLAPYALELDGRLDSFASPQLQGAKVVCQASWQVPELRVGQLSADLYGGHLQAHAALNAATRALNFSADADGNVQNLPAWRTRLTQLNLKNPPQLNLVGNFFLPPWTNQNSNWFEQIQPSLQLLGKVAVTNFDFRGASFSAADFHFAVTNQTWRIPDLRVLRPEGVLESSFEFEESTQDYHAQIHSTLDVNLARLFLSPEQQQGFELTKFSVPPELTADLRGRVRESARLDVKGRVALTNFTFRGEPVTGLQSALEFTNQVLTLVEPRVQLGVAEQISAASVRVDFNAGRIFITNGLGSANPLVAARAIGPVAAEWFEPYHFSAPPTSRVNGSIAFDLDDGVDLHFDFEGGPFAWSLFKVPRIAGQVDWVNDSLTLKNIRADFYRGTAAGGAEFYFPKGADNRLRFDLAVTNADLHLLLGDLNPSTNKLKGLVTGRWAVTQGIPEKIKTWAGRGQASLREGLLMEIPVFGVLTPALEGLAPGLGSTRLSEGSATFVMTNGIIHSDDVDIRASGMRLQYRGDVDFEGRVNARAEAELLRDTWVVGRMLSLALWPVSKVFEYKISGTLAEPKMEPLYFLPRLILMPLHPIESMKELMPKAPEATNTFLPPTAAP